ncbi:MAG: aminotransferase class I/II-fold pyridoxal phosphate-dependent enzyme [Deltaproteobacteria bacterium]|nr:aminotransferase class I/II-fold pyridoxal phosphate-dependent enzyme [Deltaproteobacteria bacterium]
MDEAYIEYATAPELVSSLALTSSVHNCLTMRTFSKMYGLAGTRIGYAATRNLELAGLMERVRQPFNANALAQLAAVEALADLEHVARTRAMNEAGEAQLRADPRARPRGRVESGKPRALVEGLQRRRVAAALQAGGGFGPSGRRLRSAHRAPGDDRHHSSERAVPRRARSRAGRNLGEPVKTVGVASSLACIRQFFRRFGSESVRSPGMGSREVLTARPWRVLPAIALLLGLGAACGSGAADLSVSTACQAPVPLTTAAAPRIPLRSIRRRRPPRPSPWVRTTTPGGPSRSGRRGRSVSPGTACTEVTTRSWRETTSPTLARPRGVCSR